MIRLISGVLSMVTKQEFFERINYLESLKDGWLRMDGQGKEFDKQGLVWLKYFFNDYPFEQFPYLFPGADDNEIVAEWIIKDFEQELDLFINIVNKKLQWIFYDFNREHTQTVDFDSLNKWKFLKNKLDK